VQNNLIWYDRNQLASYPILQIAKWGETPIIVGHLGYTPY
jgi:hypothetical protein